MPAFSSAEVALAGSGMFSLMETPWPGLMPQVTVGAMSAASIFMTSS